MGNTISNDSAPTPVPTGTSIVSGEDDEPGSPSGHRKAFTNSDRAAHNRSSVDINTTNKQHSHGRHAKSPVSDELLEDISSAVALSGGLMKLNLDPNFGATSTGTGAGLGMGLGSGSASESAFLPASKHSPTSKIKKANIDLSTRHDASRHEVAGSPYPRIKTSPVGPVGVRKSTATTNVDLATASAFMSSSVFSYDGTLDKDSSPSSSSLSASSSPSSSPNIAVIKPSTSQADSGSHKQTHATPKRSKILKGSTKPSSLDIDHHIRMLFQMGAKQQPHSKAFCMSPSEIKQVCKAAYEKFMSQPILLELGTPVKVVGDIHGQFGDLIRIFNMCGVPPKTNYLFLGDYVDRGKQSLETILLLLLLKIKYPENVFLLRGNHECANVTKVYGFYDECKRRLPSSAGIKCWRAIVDVFNTLPLAAIIGGKIFCIHGGLSPALKSLNDIRKLHRPSDVPDSGLLCDLLWSDPDATIYQWAESDRGVSYCFGKSVVDVFCKNFKFDLVARGHMVVEDGYEFFDNKRLVTIFSAPNYCGEFDNWGAVMSVNKDMLCSFDLLKPRPYTSGAVDSPGHRSQYNNGNRLKT